MSTADGRVLGLDPGEVRIGVALSDAIGMIAQPHSVIYRKRERTMDVLKKLVDEYAVTAIVIGLPVSLDGSEGTSAERSRSLGALITQHIDIPVEYCDERFTTVQAEQALLEGGVRRSDRKEKIDMVAAALMLQGFLDRLSYTEAKDDPHRESHD